MLDKVTLEKLYFEKKYSIMEIADFLKCSPTKVSYWFNKFHFKKRTIAEAVYLKNHPHGDPFQIIPYRIDTTSFLYGIGFGLYWGEGTKASKSSVRLGNTDPKLIKMFIKFLIKFFHIKKESIKFGLQIFSDIDPSYAKKYWIKFLGISSQQFYKVTVTRSVSKGTYTKKAPYGVLTLYFNNTKLRNILNEKLEKIRNVV